jgi:uncharacterized protein (TIGR03437 family)
MPVVKQVGAVLLLCAFRSVLLAQAPIVTAVVNDATGDTRLSPGVFARVYYTPNISDWYYPIYHETITIYVDGVKALILAGESPAKVLLPRESKPGSARLVLTTAQGNSPPFPITLDTYSPGLYSSDRPGFYSNDSNLLAATSTYCANQQADRMSAHAVGLGPTDPIVPTLELNGGSASTVIKPEVSVAGKPAEVLFSQLALPHAGLYQIEFRPSPDTPEGLQPVVLTIGGRISNSRDVMVGTSTRLATGLLMRAAPDSLAIAAGCSKPLANGELTGDPENPPTTLDGTTVTVTDSTGAERKAALHSVSPQEVTFVVPPGTASGRASVSIAAADGSVSTAPLDIENVTPGLFDVPCCLWSIAPKGYLVRVREGSQSIEPLLDDKNQFVPIDLGPETDVAYLVMFGTGLRNRSSLAAVKVNIGGVESPVEYAGPQGHYAGLDQVNVRLPRSLAGQSDGAWLQLSVEGKVANQVLLYFK